MAVPSILKLRSAARWSPFPSSFFFSNASVQSAARTLCSLTRQPTRVALELLVAFLTTAQQEQLAPDESIAFVPASRYGALLTAAQRTLASIQRHSAPPHPSPARSPASPGPSHPKNPLPKEWAFNGTHCAALGRDAVPIQYCWNA